MVRPHIHLTFHSLLHRWQNNNSSRLWGESAVCQALSWLLPQSESVRAYRWHAQIRNFLESLSERPLPKMWVRYRETTGRVQHQGSKGGLSPPTPPPWTCSLEHPERLPEPVEKAAWQESRPAHADPTGVNVNLTPLPLQPHASHEVNLPETRE